MCSGTAFVEGNFVPRVTSGVGQAYLTRFLRHFADHARIAFRPSFRS